MTTMNKNLKGKMLSDFPEIAEQFDVKNNSGMTPETTSAGSGKSVWWCMDYTDPRTGKTHHFMWKARIITRVYYNTDCPYLTGKAAWPGFNSLQDTHPDVAATWNYEKNGALVPENVLAGSSKIVWWILPYDDPVTGEHFDFEWQTSISNRALKGTGCPYLTGAKLYTGFNDLETVRSDLAREWSDRNLPLTPDKVMAKSSKRVWWHLDYKDPGTGEVFPFEWEASISNRFLLNTGCPYLTGSAVWPGFNDLESRQPELSKEWSDRNGDLRPSMVHEYSRKRVWWAMDYTDPKTGKTHHFEWKSSIRDRTNGSGCPYITGKSVWVGYNDLESSFPGLCKEWSKKNDKKPSEVTVTSSYNVIWILPYDDPKTGQHFDFEWKAPVYRRTIDKTGCPYLEGKAVMEGFNDLKSKRSALAADFAEDLNHIKASEVHMNSTEKYWWRCRNGHVWRAGVAQRAHYNSRCPYCTGHRKWKD